MGTNLSTGACAVDYPNLSTAFRAIADRLGDRPALRFKRDGQPQNLTWTQYRKQVLEVAAGLLFLGIDRGDAVAILSENRHEWLIADLAILTIGAVTVPLHAPLAPAQVEYQINHSRAKALFVGNLAQAAKVQSCLKNTPNLATVISFDPIEAGSLPCRSWYELITSATHFHELFDAALLQEAEIKPDDLATIIYTSGTTGDPKGVMLSHGNLLSNAQACGRLLETAPDDVQLNWLPFSHIYARTCDHYATMFAGATLALAGSMETILADFVDVGATRMNSVPRFYDKLWSLVERIGPSEERARRLRELFGPTVRQLTSGGAPLSREVAAGFAEAGLLLLEGYGLTESSPVITYSTPGANRPGSVGRALPGAEVRIAVDGEILTRGPHVMLGYWQDPEATRLAIVDDWLHTGDVGRLDEEGFLSITDRKKDLIITSCGKNIAPALLERLLTADPYIDQAVTFGDRKPFVTALIVPNFEAIGAKAEELGCPIGREGEMIAPGPILDFLAERVEKIMQQVGQPERVRAFLALGRPFQVETGELTATLKVRRRQILRAFEAPLEALYRKPPAS